MKRLSILGIAAAMAVLSAGIAEAASLGTNTGGFSAASKVVGSCGTGMTVAYTTSFDAGIPGYAVDGISLSNIPAGCLGERLSVTFYNGTNGVGSTVTALLSASAQPRASPLPRA